MGTQVVLCMGDGSIGKKAGENAMRGDRIPINENCAVEGIPENAQMPDGRKAILVPVAKTMTDYIWGHHTLDMFRYMKQMLHNGRLEMITGIRARNLYFNGGTFKRSKKVNYWKIDRENIFADIPVTLTLETVHGSVQWEGFLCFRCAFENNRFNCRIVDLTADPDRRGCDILNKFLVPVYSNRQVDFLTQRMWKDYGIPEGLTDPKARNPFLLAHRMGYRIFYCRFRQIGRVSSVFFFGNGEMEVSSDVYEVDEQGNKMLVKKFDRTPFSVPAGSILVNENIIRFKYLKMKIYHECIHGQWHYLYYRLQELTNNDPTNLETRLVPQEEYKTSDDPLYFMEKQAKRGQFGLDMPRDATLKLIEEGEKNIVIYKNGGDRYEKIGAEIMRTYGEPDFFVRARMIQLGRLQAYGSYNRADRQMIEAYGFSSAAFSDFENRTSEDEEVITYRIDEAEVKRISRENEDFCRLLADGDYVYVPGHVVLNDERYVEYKRGKLCMTDLALKAVDRCCIRFVQIFVQELPGRFVFDRMYYDSEFYAQTQLYVDAFTADLARHPDRHPKVKQEDIHDEYDAREYYCNEFPIDFYEGIKQLLRFNGISLSKMAEDLDMNEDTLKRRLNNPRDYRDSDFLAEICLYFKLPDWHSELLFQRARMQLYGNVKRDKIIQDILSRRSNDGIEAANEYLIRHGEPKLGAAS